MADIQLEVIPESFATGVVMAPPSAPVMQATGDTNYLCGACRIVLLRKVFRGQMRNIDIKCPACGAFNRVPNICPPPGLPGYVAGTHTGPTPPIAGSPAGASRTPGKNAPCPCGSGKKFKRCCGK